MGDLGNKNVFAKNLHYYMNLHQISRHDLCAALNFKYSTVSEWLSAKKYPRIDKIEMMAHYFDIQKSDLIERKEIDDKNISIAENIVSFPVIGEIAAGYGTIAIEDWSGETINIPSSYLGGRNPSEFLVLKVHGDSMYPLYQEGDKVLILKQSTMNRSGDIGAILYDDELVTLKKIEYVYGEDWLKLIPINPNHPPKLIENEELEHCRVIGIPKLLVREL